MSSKLRKINTKAKYEVRDSESDLSEDDDNGNWNSDEDYKPKEAVGEKKYEKVYINLVSDKSCTLSDRRMTYICQQSD